MLVILGEKYIKLGIRNVTIFEKNLTTSGTSYKLRKCVLIVYEPHQEGLTHFLHMRKQRRRSAAQ